MLVSHFMIFSIFLLTVLLLTFILYLLGVFIFSTGSDDDMQVDKFYAYECGFSSFNDARNAFDIKFYLVAILFLIFDLEIAFFLPFSTTLLILGVFEFIAVIAFIVILTVGFVFEWKKGGLDW
jgi:NADH:ubiquinone oxidoreductase subunit 3 (subunit A)